MDYYSIKTLHQTAVALSLLGFLARGVAGLAGAAWVRGRAARSVPHVVDTVLLLSAITLAWQLGLNPLVTPWLLAKIIGLLVYIALGVVALRPSFPLRVRSLAWVLALTSFGYIASVAITKDAAGFFGFVV
ncbi:MAG: SirB2 family protein [Pseudomonadota bacterium]